MKRVNRGFLLIIILLLVISSAFYAFSNYVDSKSLEMGKQQLIESTKNVSSSIKALIEKDGRQLHAISKRVVAQSESLAKDEIEAILTESLSTTDFDHFALYMNDDVYTDDTLEEIAFDESIMDTIVEKDVIVSHMNHDDQVGIHVPVYEDGNVVGVLCGLYQDNRFDHLIDIQIFNNEGYYSIVNASGDFLYKTPQQKRMYKSDNIFDELETATFYNSSTLAKINVQMHENRSFSTNYAMGEKENYTYFKPLDHHGWYLMTTVPTSYLVEQSNPIKQAALQLLVLIGIVFFLFILFILLQNRSIRKHLLMDKMSIERILDSVPLPMMVFDTNRNIKIVNELAAKSFHEEKASLQGRACSTLATSNCNSKRCAIEVFLREHNNTTYTDLHGRHYMVTTTPFFNEQHITIGYIEVLQDIDELIGIQKDLEERTLELETISENLIGGILITRLTEGFPVIRCNQGYLDMIHMKEEDVINKPAVKWLQKEVAESVEQNIYEQLKKEGIVRLEHILKTNDQREIWVSLYGKQSMLHNENVGIWLLINIDEKKKAEQRNMINEQRYQIAFETTDDIFIDYDIEKDIMTHNERVKEVYGVDEVVEHPCVAIARSGVIDPISIDDYRKMFAELNEGVEKKTYELLTHAKNGEDLWVAITFTSIFNEGRPIRAIGIIHDITDQKNAMMQYKREVQYRKLAMEDVALYYEADLTRGVFLTGFEELMQRSHNAFTDDFDTVVEMMITYLVCQEDRDKVYQYINRIALMKSYKNGENKIEFEYQRQLGNDEKGWVSCTIYLMEDEETKNIRVIGYIKDIDESKKLELYLKKQAEHDLLTGLYNKMTTESLIEEQLHNMNDTEKHALMIVDLDDFKLINDTLGHVFGDAVLSEISELLKQQLPKESIIGRVGGDEFIIYLPCLSSKEEAIQQAKAICERFHDAYTGGNNNYKVSGSVGVAFAPDEGNHFTQLYHKADIALYNAKNSGKDMYSVYGENLPQIGSIRNTQRIDVNTGMILSGNLSEYVLHILYEAKHPKRLLNAVLELVTKQFNFSRSYVFERDVEHDCWMNTYEWCMAGIPTQKENLQRLVFDKPGFYEKMFNEQGEFIGHQTSQFDASIMKLINDMHIKSFVQIAIKKEDEIFAFIGFDDCVHNRKLSNDEMATLHIIVMLLDVFIFKKEVTRD